MDAIEKRARFEEWFTKSYPGRDLETWPDGEYAYSFAALAWEVWQAALTPPEGEALNESDKDVALAQAVEFAEYVERQAKGAMVDAAKRFLSLPYAQELAKRLATCPEVP